jgi:hypothetical protein
MLERGAYWRTPRRVRTPINGIRLSARAMDAEVVPGADPAYPRMIQGSSQRHEKALSGRPSVLHDRTLAMQAALVTRIIFAEWAKAAALWRRRNSMLPIWPPRLIPS